MPGAEHFEADARLENRFAADEVKYELKVVSLDEVDIQTSKVVNARLVHVRKETVDNYRLKMESRTVFPPLVGYFDHSLGKIVLVDGVQRISAQQENGDDTTKIYVLSTNTIRERELVQQVYPVALNEMHGLPLAKEEKEAAIMNLLAEGHRVQDVSRIFGVSEAQVRNVKKVQEARAWISGCGADPSVFTSNGVLIEAYGLRNDSDVRRVASFIKDHPRSFIPAAAMKEIVDEVVTIPDASKRAERLQSRLNDLIPARKASGPKGGAAAGNPWLASLRVKKYAGEMRKPTVIDNLVGYSKVNDKTKKETNLLVDNLQEVVDELRQRIAR